MGIEYSKYTYRNLSEIILRKIECTFENISKLVESFYEKSFVLLVEDISNNSMVYKKMDELDVKYLFLKTMRGKNY